MKRQAIIVDLDGTLCNCEHRRHFVTEESDWKSFYESMVTDTVNSWCETIVYAVCELNIEVFLVSGRPDEYLDVTKRWLDEKKISYSALFMRKDGDFRDDIIIKEEIYRQFIEPHYDVLFCVDDRKKVVDMWRSLGLTCLQCAEGNF